MGENGVESGDGGLEDPMEDMDVTGDTCGPGSRKLSCGMVNTCSCGCSAELKLGWSGMLYKLHK